MLCVVVCCFDTCYLIVIVCCLWFAAVRCLSFVFIDCYWLFVIVVCTLFVRCLFSVPCPLFFVVLSLYVVS